MTTPMFATTLDDARFYEWPKSAPGVHLPSITTVIKKGIPNPILQTWAIKKTARLAIEQADIVVALKERATCR